MADGWIDIANVKEDAGEKTDGFYQGPSFQNILILFQIWPQLFTTGNSCSKLPGTGCRVPTFCGKLNS
jgi:hypothetical protein